MNKFKVGDIVQMDDYDPDKHKITITEIGSDYIYGKCSCDP